MGQRGDIAIEGKDYGHFIAVGKGLVIRVNNWWGYMLSTLFVISQSVVMISLLGRLNSSY